MREYFDEFVILGIAVGINTVLTVLDLILKRYLDPKLKLKL